MTDIQALLTLPLGTLTVLVAGYLGYRVAYVGKDRPHGPMDIVFLTLVFALVAQAWIVLASAGFAHFVHNKTASLTFGFLGIPISMAVAACWRKWGEQCWFDFMRYARVSGSDRYLSAWDTVRHKSKFSPTQLVLRLTDGRSLMCDDLDRFRQYQAGPCVLGEDGSVAMFVTDYTNKAGEDWTERDFHDEIFGTEMTYVPASMIAEIKIRTTT